MRSISYGGAARLPLLLGILSLGTPAGCAAGREELPEDATRANAIRATISFLADDALEGRGTGSRGYDVAAAYLRSQLVAFGVSGAGDGDGGYLQEVPLIRTRVDGAATRFEIEGPGGTRRLSYATEYALMDTHREPEGRVSGRVVFVGYGVTAPELGWDDYEGLDVEGAIVAYLELEAPPSFPSTIRAYYSDHDVKRANAARRGAIGAIYIRTPGEEKRFPWEGMLREFDIGWNSLRWLEANGTPHGLGDGLRLMANLNRPGAEALFAGEQHTLTEIFDGAEKGQLPRFVLSKTVTIHWRATHEPVRSANVVGRLEGSDPTLKDEIVAYTAHADHLGIGPVVDGDSIYNGAMDNAAGCAVLLAVARELGARRERPARSILFLFVTGEEAGLLGSDYFAHHPTVPDGQIVANLNVDGGTALTPVSDVLAWGAEHSTLGAAVEHAARQAGFTVSPDPFPEEGLFVRSDQFSFVKQGVPSLFLTVGVKSTRPGIDGLEVLKRWLVTDYHSPQDDVSQSLQYETSARFAGFALALGEAIANSPEQPRWNEGDFFGDTFGARP